MNFLSVFQDDFKKKTPLLALFVLGVIGIIARLPVLLTSGSIVWPDSLRFYHAALSFGEFRNAGQALLYNTPLYPLLMALFFSRGDVPIAGDALILFQHILGLTAPLFFFLGARKVIGNRVAWGAALLLSIHTLHIYYEASVLTETLFIFFLSILIFILPDFFENPSIKNSIIVGVICSILTLIRPVAQFIPILILFTLLIHVRSIRVVFKAAVGMLLIYCASLLPWMMENQRVNGFFGVSKGLGINLFLTVYEVAHIQPIEETKFPRIKSNFEYLRQHNPEKNVYFYMRNVIQRQIHGSPGETDDVMKAFALEGLRSAPFLYVQSTVRSLAHLFFAPRISVRMCVDGNGHHALCRRPDNHLSRPAFPEKPFRNRFWGDILWIYFTYLKLPMACIAVLAFGGAVVSMIRADGIRALLGLYILIIGYFALLTCMFNYYEDRYRLPFDYFLFLFAIYFVTYLLPIVKRAVHGIGFQSTKR